MQYKSSIKPLKPWKKLYWKNTDRDYTSQLHETDI
jgi:hypothetical protein